MVRDVVERRRTDLSPLLLGFYTAIYIMLQAYQFNLIPLLSYAAIFIFTFAFVWGNLLRLFGKEGPNSINKVLPVCETAIKLCTDGTVSCMSSYYVCISIFNSIMAFAGDTNNYDIRKRCEGRLCYDFSNSEKFLNKKSVRESLGVGDIDFVSCSPTVYQAMLVDWMRNIEDGIPALLEDEIKALLYAGEYDLIFNCLGKLSWINVKSLGTSQALPRRTLPLPFMVQFIKEKPVSSYGKSL